MRTLSITFDPSLIDSHILVATIAGYCIVLFSLSVMAFLVIRAFAIRGYFTNRGRKKEIPDNESSTKTVMTGEENAAIAAALFLFFSEMHDQEKYVMTIKKVSRTYSPWSSKFYNIWNNMKHW